MHSHCARWRSAPDPNPNPNPNPDPNPNPNPNPKPKPKQVTKRAKWKATEIMPGGDQADQLAEAKSMLLWRGLQAHASP